MKKGTRHHSLEAREKMRQSHLGLKQSAKTREKLRQAHLGMKHTPETIEKIRQAMLGKQHTLGYRHSPETREKIGRAGRGRKHSPETREKMRQAAVRQKTEPGYREMKQRVMLGRRNALGLKHSPESRERMRQARLCRVLPTKMTSIECLLRDEFRKRRLQFEMHKTMFGRWQPDFVFEQAKLIVEADGDYWHSLPGAKEREMHFKEAAIAAGWSTWRFGEKEIQMHAPVCAKAVARFVRCHS